MLFEKIYFDMDGVLADFRKGVKDLCGIDIPKAGRMAPSENDAMYATMRKVDHFYAKLEPIEGMTELFNEVYGLYGGRVEILTAVPKPERDIQNVESDKREWVRKHLGEDVVVNVVYTEQKKYYAQGRSTLLIDDWVSNITDWRTAGGSAYHFFNVEHLRRYLSEMGVLEYMDPRSQTQTAIMRFVSDMIRLMAKTDPELTIRGNGNLERFYADCVSRVNELAEELGTDYHTYCTGLVAFMDLFRALYPIGRSLDLLYHFTEDSYLRMKVGSVLETHCGLLEEMYRSEILAGVRADARVPTDSLDELANFIFDSFSECTRCVGELNRYGCFPVNLSQPWTDFRDSVSEFRSAYRAAILRPQYVLRIDEASAEYVSHPRIAPMAIKEMVFQKRLADSCIMRNTLIVLPKGFGKTTIAALVAARVLEHGKKVLYLTPIRPLAERAFHTISSIMNNTKMAMLQKTMDKDDRADAIRFADLMISTPQCIQSDLMDGVYGLDGFGLVIYEEAHRAIGEYGYVTISKHNPGKSMGLMELSNNSQINVWMNEAVKYNSGKTAPVDGPPSFWRSVFKSCNNLNIAHIEVVDPADPDVLPYVSPISQTIPQEKRCR